MTGNEKIKDIILSCYCCRLGFWDGEEVYLIPLNFGYEEKDGKRIFYFHGAKQGRKIELISRTHFAGFELDTGHKLIEGEIACKYSSSFRSVTGTGSIMFVEGRKEKINALRTIMYHNTGKGSWDFAGSMLDAVCIFKLEVMKLSCKEHL